MHTSSISISTATVATTAVWSQPDILGGTTVFVGTRVPLRILFEYLETGESIHTFLDEFPSVSLAQVQASLRNAQQAVSHACIA